MKQKRSNYIFRHRKPIDTHAYGYPTNPILMVDPDGNYVIGAIVGAVVGGYLNGVMSSGSFNPADWSGMDWFSAGMGAINGAMTGSSIENSLMTNAHFSGGLKTGYGQRAYLSQFRSNAVAQVASAWENSDGTYDVVPDGDNTVYSLSTNSKGQAMYVPNPALSGPLSVSFDMRTIDKAPLAGHAYVSLHQGKVSQTIGLYPDNFLANGGPSRVYFNSPADAKPYASFSYVGTESQTLAFAKSIKANAGRFGTMPYNFLGPNSNSFATTLWNMSGGSYIPSMNLPGQNINVGRYFTYGTLP